MDISVVYYVVTMTYIYIYMLRLLVSVFDWIVSVVDRSECEELYRLLIEVSVRNYIRC